MHPSTQTAAQNGTRTAHVGGHIEAQLLKVEYGGQEPEIRRVTQINN